MNDDLSRLQAFMPSGYEVNRIDKIGRAILSAMMLLLGDVYCCEITGDGTLLDALKGDFAKEICGEIRDRMMTTLADLAVSMIERGMTEP